jgi:hypothetical protein
MKQTVCIHEFSYAPMTRKLGRKETFQFVFAQILRYKTLGINGDFYWHPQNQNGAETPVKLSYGSCPQTLGMDVNREEKIVWMQAGVFSPFNHARS